NVQWKVNFFLNVLDFSPIDLQTYDLFRATSLLFFNQCLLAHEAIFFEIHQPAQAHFKRRIFLFIDQGLLAAVKIDIDQKQTRFDARDVKSQHARGLDVERAATLNQVIPNVECLIGRDPDFINEIAGIDGEREC